jgi:hypothetical protein
VSGVALALLMLLDWFGGRNAWQLKWTDLLLLAIAVFAVAVALLRGAGREYGGPVAAPALALTVAGAVAVGVMLTLTAESTGGTVPLVLSLAAAAGILCGGLLSVGGAGRQSPASTAPAGRPPVRDPARARQ